MLSLLLNQHTIPTQNITGHWQVVRVCVDLAAQEWLNVGVVFRDAQGERHFRLISNLAGIRNLYDDDAAESVRFLLDQAEFALEEDAPIPAGWNVSLGPAKFVRGSSIQSIVDNLFERMVPLGKHQLEINRVDREDHPHATLNVRRTVRQLLNLHLHLAKNAAPEFWRREPIPIHRDGATIQMDIQIEATASSPFLHGSIASAWYKTKYHRNASLSQAVNAMTTASEAFPDSRKVLYLLQPPSEIRALSQDDYQAIAQDIETSAWLLQRHSAELKISQSESDMAYQILKDLDLIPEMR